MTEKDEMLSIFIKHELPHPPAKVWRALTEPELLAKWIMSTDMRPVVGEGFTFRMEPTQWWDGIVNCEVLEVEPQRRISYTWCGGPEGMKIETVVTFTLTPTESGGTLLALEHSGFVPANKFAFAGASQGWQRNMNERLREVLGEL